MARKIIIDCDPGQDDAVALFLAMASPDELELLGITTVGGNVPLELTHRNARQMCDIAGQPDVPVHAGCAAPMVRPLQTAEMIHGDTGINGIDVFDPETPLQSVHAVDFIIQTLLDADDASITLIATGPLTNIGTAIDKEPAILPKIERIVNIGRPGRSVRHVRDVAAVQRQNVRRRTEEMTYMKYLNMPMSESSQRVSDSSQCCRSQERDPCVSSRS